MSRRDAWWIAVAVMLALPGRAWSMPPGGPGTTLSVSVFYGDLSPWGHWVDLTPYGWCWAPDVVAAGWRPYTDGVWVYTDLGWTWETTEPWGWAVYHYGRWDLDPVYGWVWVPGTEWGPAWVAWREDPDWVGWAPLPPSGGWSVWFQAAGADDPRIDHRAWSFVRARELTDPRLRERIVPATRDVALLARTRGATRYDHRDGRPFDRGIEPTTLERRTGLHVTPVPIRDAASPRQEGREPSGALAFYRPSLRHASPGDVPRVISSHRENHLVAVSGARSEHPETRPEPTSRLEGPGTGGTRRGLEAARGAPSPSPESRRETIHHGPPLERAASSHVAYRSTPERAPSGHEGHRTTQSQGSATPPRAIGARGEAPEHPDAASGPTRGHEHQKRGGPAANEDAQARDGKHGREPTPEAGR